MSAILQCLIQCVPLQRYFLNDVGHNYEACGIYRRREGRKTASTVNSSKGKKTAESVCLACEMDKLFLRYKSSALGVNVLSAVSPSSTDSSRGGGGANRSAAGGAKATPVIQGDPLVTADMLTAAWKCGGMKHLAGYEQRDAHEFLHGFLEILGRHMQHYRSRVYKTINTARPLNAFVDMSGESHSQHGEFQFGVLLQMANLIGLLRLSD